MAIVGDCSLAAFRNKANVMISYLHLSTSASGLLCFQVNPYLKGQPLVPIVSNKVVDK